MAKGRKNKLLAKAGILKELALSKFTGRRIPLIANLLLTNRCNLKCFYCYVDVFHRRMEDLPTDRIMHILDVLQLKGTKIIVLLGGEPLLRNDIGTILEYIDKKGFICELITNGYLVEKYIDALRLVDSVCVSLDGDRIGNDANRGVGSFEKALEAISLLKKNRITTRIKTVVTQNNLSSLDFLCEFARKNRLLMTSSVAVVYDERKYESTTRWLSSEQTRRFLMKLRKRKESGAPIGYSFKALDYCINWPLSYNAIVTPDGPNVNINCIRCLRKDFSLYMDADGTIYPCANLWGKNGKNILRDGFDAAWNNFRMYACSCCGNIPDVDISLLLNLNFRSILNAASYF